MFPLQMSVVCLTTLAFSPSKYKSLLRLVLVLVVKNKFISLLYNGSMEVSSNTKDFKRNDSHVLCSLMHFSSLSLSPSSPRVSFHWNLFNLMETGGTDHWDHW